MRAARIYIRVSTLEQDTERQNDLIEQTRRAGAYVAGVYREQASGATADRPELQRLIADLQPDDIVVAEHMDRLTRLPLDEAEALIATIHAKGAMLSIPGLVDLAPMIKDADGVARIVLEAVQELLLKLTLQSARSDYETRRERQAQGIRIAKTSGRYKGRVRDHRLHGAVLTQRRAGHTISQTAKICGCSIATVKNAWRLWQIECPTEFDRWKDATK